MSVEEVDPVLWSRERNRRVPVPRRACLTEDRAREEADEVTLRQDGDTFDRREFDVAGLPCRLSEPEDQVTKCHAPQPRGIVVNDQRAAGGQLNQVSLEPGREDELDGSSADHWFDHDAAG